MGFELGKKYQLITVGGFTLTKQTKVVNGKNETVAFFKESLNGDILRTSLNITSDKDGKEILFSCHQGDFVDAYGEKRCELYAKTFRCRKPLLLKSTNGGEFHLRTDSIWQVWIPITKKYVIEGRNGIEATYCFSADKSRFECEIAEKNSLPPEIILTLGALLASMPLTVSDADDLSRVIGPEDDEDKKDARFVARVSLSIGAIFLIAWVLKLLALLFD